jgi:hypothetical protein
VRALPVSGRPIRVPSQRAGDPRDIMDLVNALGGSSKAIALWDWRVGWVATPAGVLSILDNALGIAPTVSASGTNQPTIGATGIVFNGTSNRLRASSAAALSVITGDCGLAFVGTLPTVGGANRAIIQLAVDTTTLVLRLDMNTSNVLLAGTAAVTTAGIATATGTRVLHGRRTDAAGTVTVGVQLGSGAETTASGAETGATADAISIGSSKASPATQFANITMLAVLVYAGNYAGQQTTVNNWARDIHGAVLS